MKPVISLVAPGNMGAAMGKRLVDGGLEVRTSIAGRSESTIARAQSAGMVAVELPDLVDVDYFLSVVPPSQALLLASGIAESMRGIEKPPIYVDCNAVSPKTTKQICARIEEAGGQFIDGGIIGGPPREGYTPTFYVSGVLANEIAVLNDFGLEVSVVDGPIGATSALKMSYAGINKGLIGIASAMILAAERNGVGQDLHKELAKSQSNLLASFGRTIPGMFPKAHRWGPEMGQISEYTEEDVGAAQVYSGLDSFYQQLGEDMAGEAEEIAILRQFFKTSG